MLDSPPHICRVIDLKQYCYCPRIFYYHAILPNVRPITYKMEAGLAAHQLAESKEKRRQLGSYGLEKGERRFNVPLYDPELGLSGELDMLIETEQELIAVDYKLAKQASSHFKLQLMAYGCMLESSLRTQAARGLPHKKVKRGFLYLLPSRKAVAVSFSSGLRQQFLSALKGMQQVVEREQMPAVTPKRRQCIDCEFRRFCNDIL